MALVISDRVKETTTTSGTGSITLGGAVGGFVTFASAIGDGNRTYYVIENDTRWEIGVGTYSSGSLSRDTVLASSIGGGKINLSGVSFVFVSLPASKTNIWNEESGDVNLPATLTLPQVIAHKVTVSGDILSSGLTNFVRTTSGNFFHAYVNDSNKTTLALYTDATVSPEWKLGLKSNPNDVNTPPNYAYIHAEDGNIGLYANSQNYLSLTHGGGFSIVNKSDSIFTSASTTGTSIIGNTAAYPSLILKAAPAQAADIQQWQDSTGSVLSCVDNNGRIGIKTDDPDYALDVAGNIGLNEYIYHNGDSNTYIRFRGDQIDLVAGGRTMLTLDETSQDRVIVNNGKADVDFRVEGDDDANLIYTDASNDKVGIGTDSPSYKLDVVGTGNFSSGIRFNDGTVLTSSAQITQNAEDIVAVSGLTTGGLLTELRRESASGVNHANDIIRLAASGTNHAADIIRNSTSGTNHAADIIRNSASGTSHLALISTNITNIALNASGVISSGNLNHSLIGSVSGFYNYKVDTSGNTLLTRMISSGNFNKDYTAAVSGWADTTFTGGGGSANSGEVLANSASGVAISGYNEDYTDIKVAALVDSAPATLNTLNEIATALSGDASLAVTLTNKINSSGNKAHDTATAASLPVGSGAKIQANTSSITTNTTAINASGNAVRDLAIASGNKAHSTATAASLAVASGAKIQANTSNISTNSTAIIASGNANHASIATNTSNISTNATNLIASGNKGSALAIAASLPVGSGAKIQANTSNISTNSTAIIASGNANHASIATNTSNISTNATNLIASGNKGSALAIAASLPVGSGAKIQANTAVLSAGGASGIAFFGDDGVLTSGDHFTYASANRGITLDGSTSSVVTSCSGITMTTNGGDHSLRVESNVQTIRSYNRTKIYVQTSEIFDSNGGSDIGNHVPNFARGLTASSFNPAYKAMVIKGKSAQSANLTEWQNSAGTVLASITALGAITTSGAISASGGFILNDLVPNSTTNALYNDGGTLKFNGSAVAAGGGLAVGSGAKIQANELAIIASGNKAHDTAIAVALTYAISSGNRALEVASGLASAGGLAVGSGAKIQANTANISTNSTAIIASGNANHASIATNTSNISTNATNLIASGNKGSALAIAASLPVGSGAKIQANAGNISTNSTAIIASGNANHASIATNTSNISTNSTAIIASGNANHASIATNTSNISTNSTAIIASGNANHASIATNTSNISTNATNLIASGNKGSALAIAASLPVGSGSKIQVNAGSITSNTNLINSSGNKAHDTATAASLAVGSGAKIQANAGNITSNTNLAIASGNKAYDTAIAVALTYAISSGNRALEVASGLASGGGGASDINGLSDCLVENNSIFLGNDPSSTTNSAIKNVAIGTTALEDVTTGDGNIAIGYNASKDLTTGTGIIAIGNEANVGSTTLQHSNVIIGREAGESTASFESRTSNVIIGPLAGKVSNVQDSVLIGTTAGQYIGDAGGAEAYVVAIGSAAMGGSSTDVADNYGSVGIGRRAGGSKGRGTAADFCVYLGFEAGYGDSDHASNMLYIANDEPSKTGAGGTIIKSDMEEKHLAIGQADLLVNAAGSGCLQIYAKDPADSSLFIEAPIGSEGDLILAASGSHTLLQVDHRGTVHASGLSVSGVYLGDYVPTSTSNALYNDGGTLKFNGSAVGGGGGLAVGSGAKIQANELAIIASGNKAHDTATAASLPVGSGAKIQANTANISTNATNLIASGNKAHDTATNLMISSGNAIRDFGESPIVDAAVQQSAEVYVDWASGNFHNIELTQDVTRVVFLNANRVGQKIIMRVTQDSSARDFDSTAWNVTRASGHDGTKNEAATLRWAGGIQPTITSTVNHTDVYGFLCTNSNGKTFDGFIIGQDLPD